MTRTIDEITSNELSPRFTVSQEARITEMRQASIEKNGGFITEDELPAIIAISRLEPLLIRHSHGRMVCSAQDVAFHVKLIDDHDEAYVRDVSWPATRR